jgi:hypothetical protein
LNINPKVKQQCNKTQARTWKKPNNNTIGPNNDTKGAKQQPKKNSIEKFYKFSFSWISKHHRTQIKKESFEGNKMGPKQNLGPF